MGIGDLSEVFMLFLKKKVKKLAVKETKEKEVKQKVEEKKINKRSEIRKITGIASDVLIRPIITEKATFSEANGVYIFEIFPQVNKISVKKAIRELYNVEPVKVNIIRIKGKRVRYGRSVGRTKNKKKAMVFLKKGEKIEFVKKP